ncbi:hypothetical protein SAMN04487819_1284 [Actinopolyspora alba]|uniref:Uncharacterized protein n=1 Tax=Actinopolyspora alba TaxID=673379 RepID=A0A1I2CN35_9ACTN|nr:hypothetical protein SAMN04487819_1284 [Actinopolyspora alba]
MDCQLRSSGAGAAHGWQFGTVTCEHWLSPKVGNEIDGEATVSDDEGPGGAGSEDFPEHPAARAIVMVATTSQR